MFMHVYCSYHKHTMNQPYEFEVHKQVVKRFSKRRIVTKCIDDLWGADLVVMNKYTTSNDGFKYMLNVIDTFSKYAWSEALKTKSGADVYNAFERIIKRALSVGHTTPRFLHTDKGREFVNKNFKRLLGEYDIRMYHTENEEKSSIIERFNRTLNNKMKIVFEQRQSFRWIDVYQKLIRDYNNTWHRTIKMKPADVNKSVESFVRSNIESLRRVKPTMGSKFRPGDRVRITTKKDTFANKYGRNWSREIFTVISVLPTKPVTYRIADSLSEEILGSFYQSELLKTSQ